jgi:hypothetical protein
MLTRQVCLPEAGSSLSGAASRRARQPREEASVSKFRVAAFASALLLAALACSVPGTALDTSAGGDSDMATVAELWSDVPPMEAMTASSQTAMPPLVRALARPVMDAMMRGLNDGAEAGHWDVIAFNLSGQTAADVEAFYTPERMASYGWQEGESACLPMGTGGVMCSFTKEEADKTTGLIILAAAGEQQNETAVFFLRAEGVPAGGTPGPAASPSSVPLVLTPIAPITLGDDLAQIDLCAAIPPADIEAVLGRRLVKPPERITYDDTPGSSGCSYEGGTDASGEAHYGYVVLTPVEAHANQPLYLDVAVDGIGDEAYFNNGGDTRQLWVKLGERAAFVVAFGDVANEDYEQAIARLLVAAIR